MKHYLTVGKLKEILDKYDDEVGVVVPICDEEGYAESYNLINKVAHLTDSTEDEIPEVIMLTNSNVAIEDFCSRACVQPDEVLFTECIY
jgi:hypothetical protein